MLVVTSSSLSQKRGCLLSRPELVWNIRAAFEEGRYPEGRRQTLGLDFPLPFCLLFSLFPLPFLYPFLFFCSLSPLLSFSLSPIPSSLLQNE